MISARRAASCSWDLGYPNAWLAEPGKVGVIYYFNSKDDPVQVQPGNTLAGCGLGCAGLLAVISIVIAWGISLGRDARRGFDTAEATRRVLEEKFGAPGDFVPAADGSIPAERMEIFLQFREATQEYRTDIVQYFSTMPMNRDAGRELDAKPFGEKIRTIFQSVRSAAGMGEDIGHMFEARNQALLDKGMGLGEYTYTYVLVYYSWLGHSPADGPGGNGNTPYVMARSQSRRHRDLIQMLSNQLESTADSRDTEEWDQWRSELAGEIEEMKKDAGSEMRGLILHRAWYSHGTE